MGIRRAATASVLTCRWRRRTIWLVRTLRVPYRHRRLPQDHPPGCACNRRRGGGRCGNGGQSYQPLPLPLTIGTWGRFPVPPPLLCSGRERERARESARESVRAFVFVSARLNPGGDVPGNVTGKQASINAGEVVTLDTVGLFAGKCTDSPSVSVWLPPHPSPPM